MSEEKVYEGDSIRIAEEDAPDTTEDQMLSSLLADLGSDASSGVTVYQVQPPGGKPYDKPAYMFKTTPDAFNLDELRDEYGGGKFRLYISKNGKLYKNISVNVAPPKNYGKNYEEPKKDNTETMSNMFMQFMEKQDQKNNEMMQMMFQMITALAGNRNNNNEFGPKDMMQIMVQMKEFLGGNPQQGQSTKEQMEMLFKGIELAKDMGGGDDSAVSLIKETMRTFGGPLAKAVDQYNETQKKQIDRINHQTQMAPAPVRQHIPTQQGNINQTEKTGNEEMNVLKMAIKPNIKMLLAQAKSQKDPQLYAEVLVDQIPDAFFDQFVSYVMDDNLVNNLVEIEQEVANYKSWFESLHTEIKGVLEDIAGAVDTTDKAAENGKRTDTAATDDASNESTKQPESNSDTSSDT